MFTWHGHVINFMTKMWGQLSFLPLKCWHVAKSKLNK